MIIIITITDSLEYKVNSRPHLFLFFKCLNIIKISIASFLEKKLLAFLYPVNHYFCYFPYHLQKLSSPSTKQISSDLPCYLIYQVNSVASCSVVKSVLTIHMLSIQCRNPPGLIAM